MNNINREKQLSNLKNVYFLGIDIQNDFIQIPEDIKSKMIETDVDGNEISYEPKLPVEGAWKNAENTAKFIQQNIESINKVILTFDTHEKYDVAHSLFWINENGEHPEPFTLISHNDVKEGKWKPVDSKLYHRMLEYTEQLESSGKLQLCIWPTHAVLGSLGHKLAAPVEQAVYQWEEFHKGRSQKYMKGHYPLTEHYGAIEAEIVDVNVPSTQKNQELLNELADADVLYVSGQALSHCVSATVRQIVQYLGDDFAKKIVLLEDTTNPVSGFEELGNEFIEELKAKGMQIEKTV